MANMGAVVDAADVSSVDQVKPFPFTVGQEVKVFARDNLYAKTSGTVVKGWVVKSINETSGMVTIEGKSDPDSTYPHPEIDTERAGVLLKWNEGINVGTRLRYDDEQNYDAFRDREYVVTAVDPSKNVELELVPQEGDSKEMQGYKKSLPWNHVMESIYWTAVI